MEKDFPVEQKSSLPYKKKRNQKDPDKFFSSQDEFILKIYLFCVHLNVSHSTLWKMRMVVERSIYIQSSIVEIAIKTSKSNIRTVIRIIST